jgi:hypothetical protein
MKLLQLGRIRKSGLELPLSKFYFFDNTRLKCSCFHKLDKSSDCAWFFIRLRSLLTFGCDGWGLPLKVCLCFVFRFEVLQQCNFLSLFLLPFQQGSHILDWFFWWVPVRLKKINGCHFNLFKKKVNSLFIKKKVNSHFGLF